MKFLFIGLFSLTVISAAAQKLTDGQKLEMAYCAVHGGGGWLDLKYHANGKVKFSYVLRPSEDKSFRELYVAFWGRTKSEGELLVFSLSRASKQREEFAINNEGWIWDNKGKPDIRDALWGMYTYRKLRGLLPILKRRPVTTLAVNHLRAGSSICETPVDFNRSKN